MSTRPPSDTTAERDTGALPISILTGFLGSGKTTVLGHLLRQPGMDKVAVIINEFGEVGLDQDLLGADLARAISGEPMVMAGGCVCCTVRNDLSETLRDLFMRRVRGEVPPFERVVLETTGLADPAPILHTLISDPLLGARYRLDGVIATIDAVNADSEFDIHPEAVKQAAIADRLLLTKTDLATPDAIARLEERLRRMNPAAPIIRTTGGVVEPSAILDAGLFDPKAKSPDVERWLQAAAYPQEHGHDHGHGHDHDHEFKESDWQSPAEQEAHAHAHGSHDHRIRSFALTHHQPVPWSGITSWLDVLTGYAGPNLLRMKGIIWVLEDERPVVLHGVQHLFHPPVLLDQWPPGEKSTRIVFITRDIDAPTIRHLFGMLVASNSGTGQVPV